ncbi:MAG: insulinase family protein [Bacteroidia bacterium]|nr:insulinase family protein [Bacteroidia bacterium]
MKTRLIFFCIVFFAQLVWAQENPLLKVQSYQLDNGLTIFLNEDSTATRVFGAVMVNAGAKHEFPEATGMAHYLEHLLFKGTQTMGTKDFEKERVHLDSINVLYDQLANTDDPEEQITIQKTINQQAIKASNYGLPNEFDKLLKSIGGTGINAFTNYEMTFYHNSFPAHEVEKWLDLYANRFQDPIFRSFQSELEVVYEEKNRAMDNMGRKIIERLNANLFPNLPYGQWSVLGKTEHLKKPSLTKMYEFYNRNYVAGNMALILTGNFKAADVKPLIAESFKDLKKGKAPKPNLEQLAPVVSEVEKVRMTPIKAAFMGWQTVPLGHRDRYALDVCDYILFNNSETGLLNQLQLDGKVMAMGAFSQQYNDAGGFLIFYVPKLTGSLNKAAELVEEAIEQVKMGQISDEMFAAAKNEIANSFEGGLENLTSRGISIGNAFNQGMSWEEYLDYPAKIRSVSKEEVMQAAQKYLGEERAELISRTGLKKPEKLEKPPYKPVITDQKGSSPYSASFAKLGSMEFSPRFLDFQNDMAMATLPGGHEVIAVNNPINELFSLDIKFKKGTYHDPKLANVVDLIYYAGAGKYDSKGIRQAFASLGCEYFIYTNSNETVFELSGNLKNFDKALKLVNLMLTDPKADEKSLKLVVNEASTGRKVEKTDRSFMGRSLFYYAIEGEKSEEKARLSVKDIKAADLDAWINSYKDLCTNYKAEINFTGNKDLESLTRSLRENLKLSSSPKEEAKIILPKKTPEKNKIYLVHSKKAVQSQIYFHVQGEKFELEDHHKLSAFNEYFGGGFSGLVLQEIREYRSLAYSAWGRYYPNSQVSERGRLMTYIGCQGDKTNEAIEVMVDLIKNMPSKPERVPSLKSSLQLKTITNFPDFKSITGTYKYYKELGFDEDPNTNSYDKYANLEMADIEQFHKENIAGKPMIITIYGDKSRMNLEKLKEIGEVVELKAKDVVNF